MRLHFIFLLVSAFSYLSLGSAEMDSTGSFFSSLYQIIWKLIDYILDYILAIFLVQEEDEIWAQFKKTYNKSYAIHGREEDRRKTYFRNRAKMIRHNERSNSYEVGCNEFFDLTETEVVERMCGYIPVPFFRSVSHLKYRPKSNTTLIPASINWATIHLLPVKNQGLCAACWSFSATSCLEYYLKRVSVSLSPQHLMDCNSGNPANPCLGSTMRNAFNVIRQNGGVTSDQLYPYAAQRKKCTAQKLPTFAKLKSQPYVEVYGENVENQMMELVATKGPVTIALDGSLFSFQMYKTGVYADPNCSPTPSHAVVIVGYGVDAVSGKKYWVIKNCWGTTWGMNGYMWIERGNNMCGLTYDVSYPVVQ